MANAQKNLDEYFRKGLSSHEIQPSKLAWERLDSQLSKQERKSAFPWLRMAAIGLLLLGFGYLFFSLTRESAPASVELTAQVETPTQTEKETQTSEPIISEPIQKVEPTSIPVQTAPIQPKQTNVQTVKEIPNEIITGEQVALAKPIVEEKISIEVPEIRLPELRLDEAVADNDLVVENEPRPYRLVIKSYGIKEEPQKQNLIAGIGTKVEKIGGLLTKVEQSFADLQDAKDNLFDINAPRRERSQK